MSPPRHLQTILVLALVALTFLQTPASLSHLSSVAAPATIRTSIHAASSSNTQFSPTYVREDQFFIYLGNGFMEIQFDKTKGGIRSVTDKTTGQGYTSAGWLFWIHLTGPVEMWLGSQDASTFEETYSSTGKTSVLHLVSHFTQGYSADVSVHIRVVDNSSLTYWSLSVKNYGVAAIDQIGLPFLSNIKPPAASSNDYAIIPDAYGTMLHNPFQTLGPHGLGGDEYPSSLCPLQMMVLGNALSGLYFATYDTTGAVKSFVLWRDNAQNVDLAIIHKLPESPGSDVVLPYDTVLGVFEGDWRNAANLYRDWALKQWWTAPGPLYGRNDVPSWFKNGFVVLYLNGYGSYPENTVFATFTEIPSRLSAYLNVVDSPVLVEWDGWEKYGMWVSPDVFPPKEGWDAFKRTVNSIHAMGQHIIAALEAAPVFETPELNLSMWLQCAAKNKDGTVKGPPPMGSDIHGFRVSPSCRLFQDWLVSTVVQLAEAGVDGVGLDSVFFGGPYDYNPQDASHAPGYGSWYAQSWIQLLTRVNEEARRVNPQFILGNEGMSEVFLPFHQVFEDDAGIIGYTWYTGIYGNAVEQTDLFDYVYNEYAVAFVGEVSSQNWNGVWGSKYQELYERYQSSCEALALTLGATVDPVGGWYEQAGGRFYLPKGSLLPSVVWASSLFAKDFVMFGRTLSPPKIGVPKTNITFAFMDVGIPGVSLSKLYNYTLPVVLVGAWSSPDGRLGIVFVNIDQRPWPLETKIDPNCLDTLRGKELSLVFENEDGFRTEPFSAMNASISLTVPAQKALTVQIIPADQVSQMIREFNEFKMPLALRQQASQMLANVGSNITAAGGVVFQSPDAKNLLNQSFDEYHIAEQMSQSENYTGAILHAQKSLDLLHQAQSKENQYQQQLAVTRIAEIVVPVAIPLVVAVGAATYYIRRRRNLTQ